MIDLAILWGKTVPGQPADYHPAIYHMLDAGQVAHCLLSDDSSPRWRHVLGHVLSAAPDQLMTWLPWLVALHDLGKCSAAFQGMVLPQRARLEAEGVPFGRGLLSLTPHPLVGQAAWEQMGEPPLDRLPDGLRLVVAEAMGAHHGRWVQPDKVRRTARKLRSEPPVWNDWRQATAQTLAHYLSLPSDPPWQEPGDISAAIMALTGFTILCDWIASDAEAFPPSRDLSLDTYAALSQERAQAAIDRAGLTTIVSSSRPTLFHQVIPKYAPRPLQAAVDDVPDGLLRGPVLAVIEAPTGEGKTEAALALAHRIARHRGTDEFYYALPTMATSNQMFLRVSRYLQDHLNLAGRAKLLHGQAHLIEDDLRIELMESGDEDDDTAALEWFAPRKRALLVPFGVGTIDQAELAALNVRHVALRCVGLAGKVLILDEVHAYDVYMTAIIERLLTWLHALGTSVILLSATLPVSRRRALTRAWNGSAQPELQDETGYPAFWVLGEEGTHFASPPPHQLEKRILLDTLYYAEDDAIGKARWLLEAVSDGGCACWITNTVAQAQALYAALREISPPDLELSLLHSRFPLAHREGLERDLRETYGPPESAHRRPRCGIVVGTQVLEQSLDLDFDLMVTDLAPIDLILQRAGRLHRHEREARPISQARLMINVPSPAGLPFETGVNGVIYEEYILRQTWRALDSRSFIRLPADYREMVEAVYTDEAPADPELLTYWQQMKDKEFAMAREADQHLLPLPDATWPYSPRTWG